MFTVAINGTGVPRKNYFLVWVGRGKRRVVHPKLIKKRNPRIFAYD